MHPYPGGLLRLPAERGHGAGHYGAGRHPAVLGQHTGHGAPGAASRSNSQMDKQYQQFFLVFICPSDSDTFFYLKK